MFTSYDTMHVVSQLAYGEEITLWHGNMFTHICLFVCVSVMLTMKALTWYVGPSSESSHQVCILRSLDQGQGHRSKRM